MLNPFKIKKWMACLFPSMITAVFFAVGMQFFGFFIGIGFMLLGALLGTMLGAMLLRNPYTKMLEGNGIMAWNIDSTGIINPFIVHLDSPYIKGFYKKKEIRDVWDRNTVMQLADPKEIKGTIQDGMIEFKIPKAQVSTDRFIHYTRPVILYNEQLGSIMTKDMFASKESYGFVNHQLTFLVRLVEYLNITMTNVARTVTDLALKPQDKGKYVKWLVYIVIGILVIAAIYVGVKYAPQMIGSIGGAAKTATAGISQTASTVAPAMPK